MKIKLTYSTLFLLLLFASCKKAEDRRCWKSRGSDARKRIDLQDFTQLKLLKNLNYKLIQDDSCYVVISGGENLLNLVECTEPESGLLQIENRNKCNFLRKLDDILEVEIHFKELVDLEYQGSEKLTNVDTLVFDEFNFVILDACGSMDLTIKSNIIRANVAYGWGDYKLSGTTEDAYIGIRSNGYGDVRKLKVNNAMEIKNESPGDMYINATNIILNGYISGRGNVYYLGDPAKNSVQYFSSGKLVKL